ncbi:MAG: P1 family peptidase [Acidobacteria bacterium]|nr:P1 family peptidase [Acidobacteriota bacterium]
MGLTDIAGIRVGHASDFDGFTGCTVILCESGAVGGVDIRGSATGTQEMDVLSPLHSTQRVHAVCLAGGSAFGLEAASGVRRFLEQKGIGVQTRGGRVPLVPSAILYDLAFGKKGARPTREMGLAAAAAATSEAVVEGNIGAGLGATVGKLFGMERAMKSGIGSATVNLTGRWAGVMVSALAVVNAFGDVLDPKTGLVLAGARESATSNKFSGTAEALLRGDGAPPPLSNTTLVVVATNARLSKVEATKLAQLGQHGMVRTISPVHTAYDGDLIIALSLGDRVVDVNALGVAAGMAVAQAIERGVRLAKPLGGLPGLG